MKIKIIVGEHKGKIGFSTSGYCNEKKCYFNILVKDSFGKEVVITLTSDEVEHVFDKKRLSNCLN